MSEADKPLSFSERLKQRQAERGEVVTPPQPVQPVQPEYTFDADLIPDVRDERTETEQQIDQLLDSIGILDAYQKWVGKEIDWNTRGRKDGFMVSCPNPAHRDSHPSAWINEGDGLWMCGPCNMGGDIFDIAALQFGIADYKTGANFHKLREAMAADFGLHVKRVANHEEITWREEGTLAASQPPVGTPDPQAPTPALSTPPPPTPAAPPVLNTVPDVQVPSVEEATVTELPVVPENYNEPIEQIDYPTLDWRAIVKPDTFLYEYMVACCTDDSPEEYHFWNGMLALGHAVGRRVTLKDRPAVVPNLLLCMLGGTGIGKSKSRSYLTRLLHEVFPFDATGPVALGVKSVSVPGSGEFLVRQFAHVYQDASLGKTAPVSTSPVNGLVDFDEFSAMLGRANRQGSSLKTIIMALADASKTVAVGSLTHGEFKAQEPFCSITASTQPRAIRTLVTKADAGSGFLNRWMFVSGGEKKKVVFGSAEVDLSRAIDRYKDIRAWGAIQRSIEIEPDALPHIIEYFEKTIYPARKEDQTDLLARTDLIMKKMMLLLTINNREIMVTHDTFKRTQPIYDYLVKCYGLIHKEIGITLVHEVGDDITTALRKHMDKHGKAASPRDLQRYLQSKKYTAQQIKQTLDNLVALDWVEVVKPANGSVGRPTVRYKLTGEQ